MKIAPAPAADRLLGAIPVLLGVVATAGLVHAGTLLAYPAKVEDDAAARVAGLAPVGAKTTLPVGRGLGLPFLDAAMSAVVCRFDLASGPFRVATPALARGFLSIAVYDRRGRAVSGLNIHDGSDAPTVVTVMTPDQKSLADAADAGGDDPVLPVVAQDSRGFVLVEAPADAAATLADITCASG